MLKLHANPNCTLCRLHKTTDRVCVLGTPVVTDVMLIGEAPGANEEKTGALFSGRSGALLNRILSDVGIEREEVFVCNAVSCRPPDNKTPTKAEIRACKKWLDYQITMVKPKYVLLLGNTPLMAITGHGGIKAKRGKPFEQDGIIYLPTYHPAYVLRDARFEGVFTADLTFFKQIIDLGKVPEEEGLDFTIVNDHSTYVEMLRDLRRNHAIAYDVETTGLYQWAEDAQVVSLGFGTRDKQWTIPFGHVESNWNEDQLEKMVEEIDEILADKYLIAHNGKFDALWMWVHYNVRWFCDFDTLIAHFLVDENDLHGLKYLAQLYFGAPDYEIDKTEKQGINVPLARHCRYLAHDVYYTRKLRYKLGKLLNADFEVNRVFEKIMMPCHKLFVEAEYTGVYLDIAHMAEVERKLRRDKREAKRSLAKWGNINWGSSQQLADLLFNKLGLDVIEKTKGGKPSTSESVLLRLEHPCVEDLLKFRSAKQQLSFFIDGWKPFLDGEYIHPSFKLHGTVTGRLSCEHPNLQQVPRDPIIRSLITAPPGWVLLEVDLSQVELRIAAELSGDRTLLDAFERGIDVHWLTAIREIARGGGQKDEVLGTALAYLSAKGTPTNKVTYGEAIKLLLDMGHDRAKELNNAWGELRKKAKAINFGYLYGMWWKKFKIYARDNYGVTVTDQEAEASRTAYFELYQDLPEWHKRQKRFARKHGYIKSLSGRKRRLPDAMSQHDSMERGAAERQAINSPVQSFANEWNLMAALQIRKEFPRSQVKIFGTVHDAVLMMVREDLIVKVHDRVLEIMRHPDLLDDFEIRMRVPIEADAKVGPWGKGVSLKKWLAAKNDNKAKEQAA